jgi:hypothetical protein
MPNGFTALEISPQTTISKPLDIRLPLNQTGDFCSAALAHGP